MRIGVKSWESEFLGETDFSSDNGHYSMTPGGLKTVMLSLCMLRMEEEEGPGTTVHLLGRA